MLRCLFMPKFSATIDVEAFGMHAAAQGMRPRRSNAARTN
ncbi:hypothetical protein KL86DES1_10790 [uncultured Desulfovibrio sp.]|uniref:Uncharacterized protein n=1 Tax=uncultured Desulfovibrio sp. TaxID=167968 RepID=A0A212L0E2_9BACT|nr:hypothetical protein KL86DES1_10790 [uncultured Desulfovibrio sp.]VZH32663.1 conserved protein of unknown function [Desulfovibrio sp. 86]